MVWNSTRVANSTEKNRTHNFRFSCHLTPYMISGMGVGFSYTLGAAIKARVRAIGVALTLSRHFGALGANLSLRRNSSVLGSFP